MFALIKKAIGLEGASPANQADQPGQSTHSGPSIEVAACVVLLEAAYADYECTEDELKHVVATMREIFELGEAEALELVDIAHKEREHAVDVYGFTRAINENFSVTEKLRVLNALWKIIYSDGVIDKYEDSLARMVVQLLRLERKEALAAKLSAKAWAKSHKS